MSTKIDMKRLHHGCGEALIAGQLRGTCATATKDRTQQGLRSTSLKQRFSYAKSLDNDPGERL